MACAVARNEATHSRRLAQTWQSSFSTFGNMDHRPDDDKFDTAVCL